VGMKLKILLSLLVLSLAGFTACVGDEEALPLVEAEDLAVVQSSDLADFFSQSARTILTTNGVKHSVPLDSILAGGPAKDGIPPIDEPKFTLVSEADMFLEDDGLGIAVSLNGVDRYYPFQILVWHEIVNDMIGDQAVLVSYCPLCGTGIVYDPTFGDEVVEFGTSGKLWNSNLVMYDRKTDSYWSQILGEAIVGELTGSKLTLLPHSNMWWKDWKADHPDGEVLSRETGFGRDYMSTPYEGYEDNRAIFFPVDNEDDSYHPKEPTFGIVIGAKAKVYPQSELDKGGESFTDEFAGVLLELSYDKSKKTLEIFRADNDEEVIPFYGFWFSWVAAHPETGIYQSV
jgi:hypothetical protein